MKEKILPFLIRLAGFTFVLYLLHLVINTYSLSKLSIFYSLTSIYLFHFFATLFVFFVVVFVNSRFKDFTGFAFMGASFFKMMAAIVFLLPLLLNGIGNTFASIISFFIPYFLYLFFETFYVVKLINSK